MSAPAEAGSRLRVATSAQRPDLADAIWEVNKNGFAPFMYHDPVADEFFGEMFRELDDFQFVLLEEDGGVAATGSCIPFRWEQPLADLPDTGWDFVLERGVRDRRAGVQPNIVSAIQIVVRRDLAGRGLSRRCLAAMRSLVQAASIPDLVAPVRPNGKHRYPRAAVRAPGSNALYLTTSNGSGSDRIIRVKAR